MAVFKYRLVELRGGVPDLKTETEKFLDQGNSYLGMEAKRDQLIQKQPPESSLTQKRYGVRTN